VQVYIYVEGRQTREQSTTNGSKPGSKVEHLRRKSQKVPTVRRTSFSCRPVCNPRLSNFSFATFIPKFEFRFKLLTFLTSPFTRGLKLKTLTPLSSPKIKNPNETLIENTGFEHSITIHLINFKTTPSSPPFRSPLSPTVLTANTKIFELDYEYMAKKLTDLESRTETP
jgi:hypothetical protein